MEQNGTNGEGKCPFTGAIKQTSGGGTQNQNWWPNQLRVNILRQNSSLSNQWKKNSITRKSLKNSIWQQ
jgi:catalase (peroxidase I)